MESDGERPGSDLTDREVEALHEVELGVEWLRRAHGKLVEFHHNTGHAMEHLDTAETLLRESGHDDLADEVRDHHLPRGVVDEDRWSYDVLESFEGDIMAELGAFEEQARVELADGRRHVAERRQEHEWKRQADE
ncbi:hypothetical protein [Halosimplex amylolyticum]|uniref:hypothetical protein n=1 Tax=Halosimplex amylolyticum TaxID=3396616 RepID=UPI003F569B06